MTTETTKARHSTVLGACAVLLFLHFPARAAEKTIVVCDHFKDPATLDPSREFSEKNHTINIQIYDGLVRLGPEGKIEPALAENWKQIDDRTTEFKLRQGVRFHNGEPFDAATVKFNIERYLDPTIGFPARPFIETIQEAQVVDSSTVRILTHTPDSLLLYRLAVLILMVPQRYLLEKGPHALEEHPVGTGAFQFDLWEKNTRVVLRANRNYWIGGFPKINTLVFKFLPPKRQIEALLQGEVDILTEMPGTETSRIAESGSATVLKSPTFFTVIASFNTRTGPLKDRRVREALNLAVNRKDLIRYDQLGNAVIISSLFMPGEFGYAQELEPYPYDPQRAKQLLREAGYPNGIKLRGVVKSEARRTAMILKKQWRSIGIDLDILWTNDHDLLEDNKRYQPDLNMGNCVDPMAHSFFITSLVVYSKSPYSLTSSPELDQALEKAIQQTDPTLAFAAMREVDRLVYKEALSLFTYQKIRTYAVRHGASFTPYVTGMPNFYSATRTDE